MVRRTQAQVLYIPHSSTAHGHALSLLLLCAHIDGFSSAGVRRPIVGRCRASTPHELLMTSAVCCPTLLVLASAQESGTQFDCQVSSEKFRCETSR